ncbi:polymeric immunoglobulin receptor-like [Seriola lalandi dorsalis]|uniref:polymeric immunoglobulin receptor-like n=1 Tax=Seriola lalandi dorsalis TaxID=1841481 RepID=UPI000C6F979E|nr:polymeric immunoglobulin receptor-like [Seriola lalandi dorsalis]
MDFLLRKTARLCLLLVFTLLLSAVSAELIPVLLGESATFPTTRNCSKENAELIHRRRDNSNRTVARYQGGKWSAASGYEDRVDQGKTVTLNNTNINDNGLYELPCFETATELDVLPFHVVQVVVGQPVTLQCHYVTTNKKVECAWWEKDGKLVFGTNFTSGEIKLDPSFKGRVSLADKPLDLGNFSATVQQFRQEDGGDYICYVQVDRKKETERRIPAATRLTVNKLTAAGCAGYKVSTGFLVAVLLLLCVALCFICYRRVTPDRIL